MRKIPKRLPNLDEFMNRDVYEFMVSDMSALKRYLASSDKVKMNGLCYEYYYTWGDFVSYGSDSDLGDLDVQDWEDVESLDKSIREEWDQWLFNKISNGGYEEIGIYDADLPSWSFMDFRRDIKNQWLVHFSDNADDIAYSGKFSHGVDDLSKLGLTTNMSNADKQYGGYNFAYLPSDVSRYAKDGTRWKYGSEAVIFRASGVLVYHYGDEEPQVIFYGKTATNINHIDLRDGEWSLKSKKTGEVLVSKSSAEDLISWLETNQRQYSKHLN